jgi:hypothetical protein
MEVGDPAFQISGYFLRIHAGWETDRGPDGYADFPGGVGNGFSFFMS